MRTASRSPVTLKIKFKSSTLDQFIERYSVDISHGGIFIRTKDPLPVGTVLKFEFQLKDASPLIAGDGTVVWTRDFDPTRSGVAPGMGVRFDRLPSESQEVLEQILAHKSAKLGKGPEAGFMDTPTKVAFGNVPTKVTPKEILDGLAQAQSESRRTLLGVAPKAAGKSSPLGPLGPLGPSGLGGASDDMTPLPNPQPFHSELDEFPDEAFEEATKVAALDALARRTARSDDSGPVPFGKSLEEDVTTLRRGRSSSRPGSATESRDGRDGPVALPVVSAVGAVAPAHAFHGLPSRTPFVDGDAHAAEAVDRRPPQRTDPFSLPLPSSREEDETTREAVTSQRLHIVPSPAGGEGAEPGRDEAPVDAQADANARPAGRSPAMPSNLPWIAAAAVLLLIVGVGGFLLLGGQDQGGAAPGAAAGQKSGQRQGDVPPAAAAATPAPAAAQPEQPSAAAAAPPATSAEPSAAEAIEVTVTSVPAGAVAELIGSAQSGPTPMTFRDLVAGQSYQVKIRKAGFQSGALTLTPEAGDPPAVELEAKPAVLRVMSEPAGAQVWINGRRQRSFTPADVKLSRRTAASRRVTVALRKAGYSTTEQQISLDDLVEQDDAMVQEVAMVLARRSSSSDTEGDDDSAGGGDSEPPASESTGPVGPVTGGASAEPGGAQPAEPGPSESTTIGRPDVPDWMKP